MPLLVMSEIRCQTIQYEVVLGKNLFLLRVIISFQEEAILTSIVHSVIIQVPEFVKGHLYAHAKGRGEKQ